MADEGHLERLKQGKEVWNEWNRGRRGIYSNADLSGVDLKGLDFSGWNFQFVDFSKADLRETLFRGANLNWADLSRAKLKGATLKGAGLAGTKFIRVNFKGVDLSDMQLPSTDFSYANLSQANLCRVNLSGATLNDTNLSHVNLNLSDLSGSSLVRANLSGASLISVNLSRASLRGSTLTGANLGDVNFRNANVGGADFHDVHLGNTVFDSVDLQEVKGLETAHHWRPSDINIRTIYLSRGKIPREFLRGCGVPETLITYIPSLTAEALDFYSCFISYSHADKSFAHRLYESLQEQGIRCWLDEHQMLPGDDIFEQVDTGIRLWDKVLLCCSKASLTSWWVDNEINTAFEKEQELMRQRGRKVLALIPLNLDDYMFKEWSNGKATQVKSRMTAEFTEWETNEKKYEEQFERLVRALRADAAGREIPPVSKL